MNNDSMYKLKSMLNNDEGYRQFAYTDTEGFLTIGVGRNLKTRGISEGEADYLLENDIKYFETKLRENLPFFDSLNDMRQISLINMAFNLGIKGFLSFKNMIKYLSVGDFDKASEEMMNSKWSTQVKDRAKRLAQIIKQGS